MCYNLAVEATRHRFQQDFGWDPGEGFLSAARLSAFDHPLIPALRLEGSARRWQLARWGLPALPAGSAGSKDLYNARWETAHQKPSFRDAYHRGRMVLVVTGFWEWRSVPGRSTKQLVQITPPTHWLFLAALGSTSAPGVSPNFTLLTVAAFGPMADFHDRMPLALNPASLDSWLAEPDRAQIEEEARTQARGWKITAPVRDDGPRGLFDDPP